MNEMLRDGEAIFAWVLQSSWQAGVLVLVVVLAQTIFRRQLSPAWRYGLWLLVLVRLLLPKPPQAAWSIYNVADLPAALEQQNTRQPPEITHAPALPSPGEAVSAATGLSVSWHQVGLFVWILGASAFALRLVSSNLRFSRQVRRDSTALDDAGLLLLKSCQEAMSVGGQIAVLQTSAVRAPSIHGLWRKRLLLPKETLELLSREELRCVFLHELAHIRRRDLELSWLASMLLVVHWFNPLLWLACSRMRNDCELACDALVLTRAGLGIAQPYGDTILKVVEHLLPRSAPPGVLALSEEHRRLKERIWMIARFKRWPRWSVPALTLTVGIAAVGLTKAVPDPIHNGKRLSEWLLGFDNWNGSPFTPSAVAVSELGTNAIPAIVKMTLTRSSQPKDWLIMRLEKYPKLLPHGFATAARRRERAARALSLIGPPAQAALPYYLDALTNGDRLTRNLALNALGSMDHWAGDALPTLISLQNDPEIRGNLIAALGRIRQRPDFCVPFFTQALGDTNINVRRNAAYGLGSFGADAKDALPALTNALQDQQTAQVASYSIKTIQAAMSVKDLQ